MNLRMGKLLLLSFSLLLIKLSSCEYEEEHSSSELHLIVKRAEVTGRRYQRHWKKNKSKQKHRKKKNVKKNKRTKKYLKGKTRKNIWKTRKNIRKTRKNIRKTRKNIRKNKRIRGHRRTVNANCLGMHSNKNKSRQMQSHT